jgi:hypothetical protein
VISYSSKTFMRGILPLLLAGYGEIHIARGDD